MRFVAALAAVFLCISAGLSLAADKGHGDAHADDSHSMAAEHGADAGHGKDHGTDHGTGAKIQMAQPEPPGGAICEGFGPQTPRDISNGFGLNATRFIYAPFSQNMNLCNIHTHTQAEHRGPGFELYSGPGDHGGYRCNDTLNLSAEELQPWSGRNGYAGVVPGDTIEVHWVYSSCPVAPGPGLGSCLSDKCANPQLRVESQVFLVVNDPNASNFMDYVYHGDMVRGRHQPKALPTGTGAPIVFAGSTTGTSYTQEICSPMQVTWSVRPRCAKLHIGSLHEWGLSATNVFEEDHSHGVRALVTSPLLLSHIE